MRKKTPIGRSRTKRSNSEDELRLLEQFERAFLIIDSAVTGAMISGTPPEAFNSLLSYLFLQYASQRAQDDEVVLQEWRSLRSTVWDDVLICALAFSNGFEGPVYRDGDLEELDFLREKCSLEAKALSEFEAKRYAKSGFPLIIWLQIRLAQAGRIPNHMREMATLVVWFKTQALGGKISDRMYAVARQNPPLLCESYLGVLNGSISGR